MNTGGKMKKYRKKLSVFLAAAFTVLSACSSGNDKNTAESSLSESSESTAVPAPEVTDLTSIEGINAYKDKLYSQYLEDISGRRDELESGSMTIDGVKQYISFQKIGKPDENGYPLYIGLRGGGNCDKNIALEQYEFMQHYYSCNIDNGIYVVPCCVRASWDEHFRPESFQFYDRIIEDAIAFYNVDPNRVYLLGFSSGGDGVYAASPRIADRFAAVNMSAGYPNEQRLENMANLPICIQMGENDTAYNRNTMAAEYDSMLLSVNAVYGVKCTYETFIHKNGTHNEHWSDLETRMQPVYTGNEVVMWLHAREKAALSYENTCAVTWVSKYKRDPLPETILWNTDVNASLRKTQAFYWLDRDGGLDHSIFKVSYNKEGNSVNIEKAFTNSGTLKIYLCPEMLDVFSNVKIVTPDGEFIVKPEISKDIMRGTLYTRGDKNYIFTSEINVTFKDGKAIRAEAAGKFDDSYTPPEDRPLYRWSSSGVFYVDNSLFGLRFGELCKKLGSELAEPIPWEWDGYYNCEWTYLDASDGRSVIFLLQEGKCAVIYSEEEMTNLPVGFKDEEEKYLGQYVNGLEAVYTCSNNEYDGKSHLKQEYMWYKYQRWENMDESISLG